MVRILVAAVGGGLISIPLAAFSGLAMGLVEQSFTLLTQSVPLFEGGLFVLICALLLAQRRSESRAQVEAASAWRASTEVRPIPPELRQLPVVRRYTRALAVALTAIGLGAPFFLAPDQISHVSLLFIYS